MLRLSWPNWLASDARHTLRLLRKSPVFTTVTLLSLGLGIGANVAMFSIVHALILKPLPVHDPQQLVQITLGESRDAGAVFTNPLWEQIRDRSHIFDSVCAVAQTRFDVASGGERQYIRGLYVSGDFFTTLGVPAVAGRTITRDDDRRNGGASGPVAVLSHEYWRERYGASPEVIGSTIRLDGQPFTVVGVTPGPFFGVTVGAGFDVAVPLATEAVIRGEGSMLDRRANWWLTIVGRLRSGESAQQAEAALRTIAPRIRELTIPEQTVGSARDEYLNEPFTVVLADNGVSPLRARYRTALLVLVGTVAIVLLMACANLANLQLARASARRKEFGLRLALGASRGRLIWQVLTESAVLVLGGGVLGLLLANWASRLIVRQISTSRATALLDLSVDWRLLSFTFAVAAFTVCIVGLAPALRAIGSGATVFLRGSSRSVAAGWRGMNLEKSLVVIQVALSLVLVFGAALFVRSFATLATLDAGFDRRHVLVASVDTPAGYSAERRRVELQQLLEALRAHPDIRSAAQSAQIPLTNNSWTSAARAPGVDKNVFMNRITPGYFTALGTPIYAGRDFTAADTPGAPLVAIVNEQFARTFFGEASPIGRTFELDDLRNRHVEVVGVVKDSRYLDLRRASPETVFLAASQSSGTPRNFIVRSVSDPARVIGIVANTVREMNPDLRLEFRAFDTIAQDSLAQERLLAMLSGFFGVLALLVAGVGLYGVMSLAVSGRRREIALRMALGARHFSVVWLVMRDVAIVTAIGMSAGVLLGWLGGRLVATLLVDVPVSGTVAWGIATGLLATAAGLAGYLPARRAARVDPMLVLREE